MPSKVELVTEEALNRVIKDHHLAKAEQIISKVHAEIKSDINMPSDSLLRQKINYEKEKINSQNLKIWKILM